jgi:FlaA1/EpsC-like NDP-sugar epimerase
VLTDKRVVVTGGTGSLGQALVRRLLGGEMGLPGEIVVFSRDEAKQHEMRLAFEKVTAATDEVVYLDSSNRLRFRIGDVGNFHSVAGVLRNADVVFNAAAMKQVPACEYAPLEAVHTNVGGPGNVVRTIRDLGLPVETVVCISTDKACKPVNVMGMTKAIQERIFIQANLECPATRFVGVRYGNVLASRGSVVPLFHHQIRHGGPVTITTPDMTRFLLSLDDAVDVVLAALREASRGEIYVPRVPAARVADVAAVLVGERPVTTETIGIRPGEKIHEILVSEEEASRTSDREQYYAIAPGLPELQGPESAEAHRTSEFSSADNVLDREGVAELLKANKLTLDDDPAFLH